MPGWCARRLRCATSAHEDSKLVFVRVVLHGAYRISAEEYRTRIEESLGDAYSELAADVLGYIDYVKSQK